MSAITCICHCFFILILRYDMLRSRFYVLGLGLGAAIHSRDEDFSSNGCLYCVVQKFVVRVNSLTKVWNQTERYCRTETASVHTEVIELRMSFSSAQVMRREKRSVGGGWSIYSACLAWWSVNTIFTIIILCTFFQSSSWHNL